MTIPARNSTAYHAATYLHREGPQSEHDLFAAVHFGQKPHLRADTLERAIFGGWLVRTGDLIGLSGAAREHFEGEPEVKRYVGEVAGPRIIDVLHRKPYVPERRRVLREVPAYSVRKTPNFHKG